MRKGTATLGYIMKDLHEAMRLEVTARKRNGNRN